MPPVTTKRTTLTAATLASPTNMAFEEMYQFLASHVHTLFTARVVAVDEAAQRLTIEPLEQQKEVSGQGIPNGQIHDVPYGYEESSNGSLKIAPGVGDIGLCGICQRDITTTKTRWESNTPPTTRMMAWPDAVWLRCLKAAQPSGHVVTIGAKTGVTVSSPHSVAAKSPALKAEGNLKAGGGTTHVALPAQGAATTVINGMTADVNAYFRHLRQEIDGVEVCDEIRALKKEVEANASALLHSVTASIKDMAADVAEGLWPGDPMTGWIKAVEQRARQVKALEKRIVELENLAEAITAGVAGCVGALVAKAKEIPDCALQEETLNRSTKL